MITLTYKLYGQLSFYKGIYSKVLLHTKIGGTLYITMEPETLKTFRGDITISGRVDRLESPWGFDVTEFVTSNCLRIEPIECTVGSPYIGASGKNEYMKVSLDAIVSDRWKRLNSCVLKIKPKTNGCTLLFKKMEIRGMACQGTLPPEVGPVV